MVLPSLDDPVATVEFVLPRIVADPSNLTVMSAINGWIADLGKQLNEHP